ncbi:MAG: phenylalanine--tRNA ligase subunit alpha, partial [Planctomycetaceae bacterium]
MELLTALDQYEQEALTAIAAAASADALEQVRIEFLGKKKGRLRDLQTMLGRVEPDQRPVIGKEFNKVKTAVSDALERRQQELSRPRAALSALDVTLPGQSAEIGRPHPLTRTMLEFKDLMGRFGFSVVEGPEIEDEQHNFISLNIPEDHPARDPLDNFYLASAASASGGQTLLRSQTTTVQIRIKERTPPPVRI